MMQIDKSPSDLQLCQFTFTPPGCKTLVDGLDLNYIPTISD